MRLVFALAGIPDLPFLLSHRLIFHDPFQLDQSMQLFLPLELPSLLDLWWFILILYEQGLFTDQGK